MLISKRRPPRGPVRSWMVYEVTATAALLAVDLAARAAGREAAPAGEEGWDEVHGAALESFPASDPPPWGALRAGPPAGDRHEHSER
jgi:hypothetical protein